MARPGLGDGESIEIATIDDETAQKLLAELDKAEEKAKEEQAKKEREAHRGARAGGRSGQADRGEAARPGEVRRRVRLQRREGDPQVRALRPEVAARATPRARTEVNRPAAQATPAGAGASRARWRCARPGQPSKSPAQPTPPRPGRRGHARARPGRRRRWIPKACCPRAAADARTAQAAQPPSPARGRTAGAAGRAAALTPSPAADRPGHRQRHPGSPEGPRRGRRDRAERQEVEVRLVLQPGEVAGARALAPGRRLPPPRSHRVDLRQQGSLHPAARAAQARRLAGQPGPGDPLGGRVPGRRGDGGLQAGPALPQPAARSWSTAAAA